MRFVERLPERGRRKRSCGKSRMATDGLERARKVG